MIEVRGKVFDGNSSTQTNAVLRLNDSGQLNLVSLDGEQNSQTISHSELKISSRLGNSARYIELGSLGRFETTDNNAVDAIADILLPNNKSSLLHKLESNIGLILVAVVITSLFVAATVRWGVPVAADKIVDVLPEKTADVIEQKILAQLENRWFKPSNLSSARQDELNVLFDQVVERLDANNKGYVFKLRDAEKTIGANALAFPSGTIVMTDQLVELASDDVQLAGIMAHEVGHLEGKHSLRQLVRASILTFVVAFIAGDVSGASSTLIAAPVAILQLSYSREFETDADNYALDYLGCDKDALDSMADFFNTIANIELVNAPPTGTKNNKPVATEPVVREPVVEEPEPSNTESEAQESQIDSFLATHPASSKRSGVFADYFDNECQ